MIGKKKRFADILALCGILLILGAVIITSASVASQKISAKRANEIAEELRSLIPELGSGYPDEERSNTAMPMLEIDGMSFIGIVEVPLYDSALPVYASWKRGKVDNFPCRYTGSVYDGTLVIGGSDSAGQLDFMKTVTESDRVFFIDTEGMRYSYTVSGIEITDAVSPEYLTTLEADLVIFARNTYSLDYTVIKCEFN